MNPHAVISRPVDIGHLPKDAIVVVATNRELAELAAAYDLIAATALSATVALTPGPRGSVEVQGRVIADIVQTCVVSLAPVDQHIDEPFSLRFVRASDAPPPAKRGAEVVVAPNAPDPPEILEGTTIDVGAVVEEAFVLAIDPYPRAPGVALPVEFADPADRLADSPFAALAGLADKASGKG